MSKEFEKIVIEKLNSIDGRLANVETDVSELKEDVSNLKEDVSELKEKVGNLEKDVSELKEKVGNLEKDVSELKEKVGNLEEDVVELKEGLDIVRGSVVKLEQRVMTEFPALYEAFDLNRSIQMENVQRINSLEGDSFKFSIRIDNLEEITKKHSNDLKKLIS